MTGYRLAALWTASFFVLAGLVVLGTALGATSLPTAEVGRALLGVVWPGLVGDAPLRVSRIVLDLRLPRVLLAICVGAGLSVVGALLQTVTRNDLADPFLFGLSSGAAAGAVSVITVFGDRLGLWTLPLAAFAGALLATMVVLTLMAGQRGRGQEKLVIAGLAVSFLFGSLTSYLVFSGDQRAASSVMFWSVGGLGTASWSNLPLAVGGTGIALLAGLLWHRSLDALLGGEDTALSLGVNIRRLRRNVFLLCALSTASLVALSGVIGFVGLMIPHLARGIVGVRHAPLLVTTALLGAMLLLAGDVVSRTILAPQELPVGIITAAAGGAFVLALVFRRER